MNAQFRGIDPDTGFDYDADRLDRLSDRLIEDEDFCADFAARHASDFITLWTSAPTPSIVEAARKRIAAAWDKAVSDYDAEHTGGF